MKKNSWKILSYTISDTESYLDYFKAMNQQVKLTESMKSVPPKISPQ